MNWAGRRVLTYCETSLLATKRKKTLIRFDEGWKLVGVQRMLLRKWLGTFEKPIVLQLEYDIIVIFFWMVSSWFHYVPIWEPRVLLRNNRSTRPPMYGSIWMRDSQVNDDFSPKDRRFTSCFLSKMIILNGILWWFNGIYCNGGLMGSTGIL